MFVQISGQVDGQVVAVSFVLIPKDRTRVRNNSPRRRFGDRVRSPPRFGRRGRTPPRRWSPPRRRRSRSAARRSRSPARRSRSPARRSRSPARRSPAKRSRSPVRRRSPQKSRSPAAKKSPARRPALLARTHLSCAQGATLASWLAHFLKLSGMRVHLSTDPALPHVF